MWLKIVSSATAVRACKGREGFWLSSPILAPEGTFSAKIEKEKMRHKVQKVVTSAQKVFDISTVFIRMDKSCLT